MPNLQCTGGALKPPTRPEPGITAVKLTPRYTSVDGLTRCARRRSQILHNSAPVIRTWQPLNSADLQVYDSDDQDKSEGEFCHALVSYVLCWTSRSFAGACF